MKINVIRVVKDDNFTVMKNTFLKDKNLSLKNKGLMATILSLKDDWNLTVSGLSKILKEGRGAISNNIKDLVELGYCERETIRDTKGKFKGYNYTFFEEPMNKDFYPKPENPYTDNPDTDNPYTDNDAQLNTNKLNTNKSRTKYNQTTSTFQEKKKSKDFSDEVIRSYNSLVKYFPEELIPKKNKSWLETIDRLNRIDGHSFDLIEEVVRKTRNDNFWRQNFLSLPKLRNKNKDGVQYFLVFKTKFAPKKDNHWKDNPNSKNISMKELINQDIHGH